jgi:hypothetical protein
MNADGDGLIQNFGKLTENINIHLKLDEGLHPRSRHIAQSSCNRAEERVRGIGVA